MKYKFTVEIETLSTDPNLNTESTAQGLMTAALINGLKGVAVDKLVAVRSIKPTRRKRTPLVVS